MNNTTSEIMNQTETLPPVANEQTPPPAEANATANSSADEAARNMVVGALWCIGGIVVTAATYSAVKDTGGHYFIAWGAIVFGGIQFFKGLFQMGN